MFEKMKKQAAWIENHPYRFRTFFRAHLPYFLSSFISKGKKCEKAGGVHFWYNEDGEYSGYYHCYVIKKGQLWKK